MTRQLEVDTEDLLFHSSPRTVACLVEKFDFLVLDLSGFDL